MGLLDFLFIKEEITPTDGAANMDNAEFKPTEKQPENIDFFPGMKLDLVQENGQQLLTGQIVTADFPQQMVIDRLPGGLSFNTCPAGTVVNVHGYTRLTIPFHLKGTVQESTRIICKLTDLKLQTYAEGRQTFRMPVSAPMSLFYQHDKYMENPEACTLVDISTGGACIESEYIHAEGEVLRMKAQIEDYAPMTFLGEIIRVEETSPGVFRYGFLFAKLKEEEITSLNRTLYNLQVGNREEWSRRTKNGNWQ